MTYLNAYHKAAEYLVRQGIEDADSDAWILFEFVTGMDRARFWADNMLAMKPEEEERYRELIIKRGERIPVQHLTKVQEFMGLEFKVNEHVLVPRQDTEILVTEVEKLLHESDKVLDMCTGSGCIIISLKARHPKLVCKGVDISTEALLVAKENAHNLGTPMEFIQSDMFEKVEGEYDLIVSNPPYIPTKVIESLEEEVRLHDPFCALDGKEDGLYFYRILAKESRKFLKDKGYLCLEIGHDQDKDVRDILSREGFDEISSIKDLAGLDRVVIGRYNMHSK